MSYMSYKDALTASLDSKEEDENKNSEINNSNSSHASSVTASHYSEEQDMRNFETSSRTSVDLTMQDAKEKDLQSFDEMSPLFAHSMPCYGTSMEETQTLEHIRFRAPIQSRLSNGLNENDSGIKETLHVVQQRSSFETPKYIQFRTLPHQDSLSEVLNKQHTDNEKNWSFSQSKPCFELEPKVPITFLRPKLRPSDWDQVHDRYRWDQLLKEPVSKMPPIGRVCRVTGKFSDTANSQAFVLTDLPEYQCTRPFWEVNLNTEMKTAVDSISIDTTELSGLPMWSVALSESDNDSCQGSILEKLHQEMILQNSFEGSSMIHWNNAVRFQKTLSSMGNDYSHDGQAQMYDNSSGCFLEHVSCDQPTSTAMHQRPHVTQSTGMPQHLECISGNNQDNILQVGYDFVSGDLSNSQATSAPPSIHQFGLDLILSSKSETIDESLKVEAYDEKDSFYENFIHSLSWGPDKYIEPTDITVYLASTGGTGGNWHPNLNSSTLKEFFEKPHKDDNTAELLRNQYDGPGIAKLVNGQGDVMTQENKVFASDSSTENSRGVGELSFLRRAWKRCKEEWKKICPKAQWERRKGEDKNA